MKTELAWIQLWVTLGSTKALQFQMKPHQDFKEEIKLMHEMKKIGYKVMGVNLLKANYNLNFKMTFH